MRRDDGFTLIELLVAFAVLAIFIVSILGLLDSSQRLAKTETELSDTQENVRYAAYHLLRTARMVGGTSMPFARDDSGDAWIAGQLQNNVSSFVNEFPPPAGALDVAPRSDVLTLRGFFEISPFFVNPTRPDINWGTGRVTVHENVGADQEMNVVAGELIGRGVVFMGQGQYAVSMVTGNTAPTGTAGSQTFTVDFESNPGAPWSTFNQGGVWASPTFPVYRVGILDSYTYYVSPDFQLMRIRAGGNGPEPVATSIGNLQCALGIDTDDDGDIDRWDHDWTVAEVRDPNLPVTLEVTVLGRTAARVPGWVEPESTFTVRDLAAGLSTVVDLNAKWRRMQVSATLRDFVL